MKRRSAFAQALVAARAARDWTQGDAAIASGVAEITIARIECGGTRKPTGDTMRKLARVMPELASLVPARVDPKAARAAARRA
jgi:transcriptional regulator with XRE-family HTH domain